MKTLHIVPHVHWDREWYFTAEESQVLLAHHLRDVLHYMEQHPNYPYYVLDGQTSILEDYLEAYPQDKDRLKQLASSGRLILGPWYTQSDEMLVGGESLVRNLYYGWKDASVFGNCMRIGYLPDSFGQCAQMPMILNGFDIPFSMFWRGVSSRHQLKSEFMWRSSDGSQVFVQMLPLCYALGRFLEHDDRLKPRMDMTMKALEAYGSEHSVDFILPNGHDQMPIQKDIESIINRLQSWYPDWNFVLDSYEHVCEKQAKLPDLKVIEGEFLDGASARVHRSIYSTRMDLKVKNTRLEHTITNVTEPLCTMAYLEGFEYPHGLFEKLWKTLLLNHAHDSLGCCCSDAAHQEIDHRYDTCAERSAVLQKYAMRLIADHQKNKEQERILVFNTMPSIRTETICCDITTRMRNFILKDEDDNIMPYEIINESHVDSTVVFREIPRRNKQGEMAPFTTYKIAFEAEMPAFGYRTWVLEEGDQKPKMLSNGDVMEDRFYRITLEQDATLTVYDKRTAQTYVGLGRLEDGSDDGDEYDYSPMKEDVIFHHAKIEHAHIQKGNNISILTYQLSMTLPVDMEQRRLKQQHEKLCVDVQVELRNDGLLRYHCDVHNTVRDHRLRLLFPSGIQSKVSHAAQPFGEITRPVQDPMMDVWEQEKWDERPDSIYPMTDYVYLQNEHRGFGYITKGSREYEIIGEDFDTLAITLMRSIGVCGKDRMERRPGRLSGIALETPDAQLMKTVSLDFALCIYEKHETLIEKSREYLTPLSVYNHKQKAEFAMNPHAIVTPKQRSWLNLDKGLPVSAIKKAENHEGILLRMFNPYQEKRTVSFPDSLHIIEVNLKEEEKTSTSFELTSNQVKTFWIKNN